LWRHCRHNSGRQNRITSVHATTAIEGNRLSVGEVAGVVNGVTVFGPPRDILEVQNAYAAYEALDSFDPYSVSSFVETQPARAGRGETAAEGAGVGVNAGVNAGLSRLEAAILQALEEDPQLSAAALATALGKNIRTIERRLARLKAAGLLERVGPDKTGIWRVVGQGDGSCGDMFVAKIG
jgi:Fic family protein